MVGGLHEGSGEVVGVVGSFRVARWLEASETHHPGCEDRYESLISFQPTLLDHFTNSGFMRLEARPNSLFAQSSEFEEQGRRSRPLAPSHGRTVGSKPPRGFMYRELRG
jgi:hypothetical protein